MMLHYARANVSIMYLGFHASPVASGTGNGKRVLSTTAEAASSVLLMWLGYLQVPQNVIL